jgi:hypothetical protein
MATHSHLSALTAGHFLSNATKSNQKTLAPIIRPLRCAPGSPRSGAFRARAAYDLLRKSTSRAFGYAEGVLRTLALQTPALGLLKSHFALPELSRA